MLGEIIRQHRSQHRLSLRAFAARCGLSHSYVDLLQKGRDPRSGSTPRPSIDTLIALAKGLEVDVGQLLRRTGYRSPSALEEVELLMGSHPYASLSDLPEKARQCIERFVRCVCRKYGKVHANSPFRGKSEGNELGGE